MSNSFYGKAVKMEKIHFYILWLIMYGPLSVLCVAWPLVGPCPCRCGLVSGPQLTHSLGPGSYKQVDCSYQNLHTLPINIPADTEVLLLGNNYINSITEENFSSFRYLKYLDLSHNFLSEIKSQTFRLNVQLKMLNLNWNQIRLIANDAFLAIEGLTRLLVSGNQLVNVPDAFQSLARLILLELSNNAIKNIHSHSFDGLRNLQFLNLRENAIDVVAPLGISNLPSLVNLQLSGNRLCNISSNSFQNLPQLSTISLGYNALANLPTNLFQYVPNTEKIDLKGNQIFNLPPNIFHVLPNLIEIDLEENSLHTIPPTIFHGLVNLRRIALQGNEHLTKLPAHLFDGLLNLELLSLSHLHEIPENFFSPIPTLTTLSITETTLNQIPQSLLFNLTNLEIIDFADNLISYIAPGAFATQENLRIMDISGNRLRTINSGIFTSDLYSLQELYLQENRITRIYPGAFSDLPALATLTLDTNRIQEIQPGIFPFAPDFRNLHLAENPIQRIDGVALQSLMDLRLLTLDSIELICDCQLRHFVDWLKMNRAIVDGLEDLACGAPWNFRGAPITRFINRPRAINCRFPMIRTFPNVQNLTTEIGNNVTLPCLLEESTDATLSWDLDGRKSLYLSSVFREPYSSNNHLLLPSGTLIIYNVTPLDSGIYTCIASNAAGADTVTYYINIPFVNVTVTTEAPPITNATGNSSSSNNGTTPAPPVIKTTQKNQVTTKIRVRTIPSKHTQAPRSPSKPITVRTTTTKRPTTKRPPTTTTPPTTTLALTTTTIAPEPPPAVTKSPELSEKGTTTRPITTQVEPTTTRRVTTAPQTTVGSEVTNFQQRGDTPLYPLTPPTDGPNQEPQGPNQGTQGPNQGSQGPVVTNGPNTRTAVCDPNPCMHGGTCIAIPVFGPGTSTVTDLSRETGSYSSSENEATGQVVTEIPRFEPKCNCRSRYGGAMCTIRKPDTPIEVEVMERVGKVITLKWSNRNSAYVQGYRVFYSLLGDNNVVKSVPIHPDVSSFTMSELKFDSTYRVCVIAFNNGGESSLGDNNCLWAETQALGSSPLASDLFSMEVAFIGGGILFVFSLLLLTVVCYSRSKKEKEYHQAVVGRVSFAPQRQSSITKTIRRSFRQPVPTYYGADDMMLLDLTGNPDRKMYMNPFDSRQSLMLNDHDHRNTRIGFGEGIPPRLIPRPSNRKTLKIQEDTRF